MPPLSTIQSIITYYQPNPPDGLVSEGDIWYNPDARQAFIFINDVWQQVDVTPITPGHSYGYNLGGHTGSIDTSITDRITFPFASGTATVAGSLSGNYGGTISCSSSDYGYVMGGANLSAAAISHIQRFSYPFGSGVASNVGFLEVERQLGAGFNSSQHGFAACGVTTQGDPFSNRSSVERFEFPFASGKSYRNSALGTLSGIAECAGCGSSRYGYLMGGIAGSVLSTIYKFEFPFAGTSSANRVALSTSSRYALASCNSTLMGYAIGGLQEDVVSPSSPIVYAAVKTVERFEFANDTTVLSAGELNSTRYQFAACNSTRYGYVMGGAQDVPITIRLKTIERFEFAFASGTGSVVGNLSSTRTHNTGLDGTQFWF